MAFEHALYRLMLAQGFLEESRQDVQLQRWRSAVDSSQLAVENSAKAVLSLAVPVGKTHNPAPFLQMRHSNRDSSEPLAVEQMAGKLLGGRELAWREFLRHRNGGGPAKTGYGFRSRFSEMGAGPVAMGGRKPFRDGVICERN